MSGSRGLQDAYRGLGRLGAGGSRCPSAGQLWSLMRGELPRAEALAISDHVATCRACIAAWQLARDLAGDAPTTAARPRGSARWPRWALAAAAGLVLALATLPWMLQRDPRTVGAPLRAAEQVEIRPAIDASRPLARGSCVLRWTAPEEAASYRVDVTTERLEVVFSARGLARPEVRIPPEALDGVPRGGRILWRVEAVLSDGDRVSSATFSHPID